MLQTLVACKNSLDEFGSFNTTLIPILLDEKKYADALLLEMQDHTFQNFVNYKNNLLVVKSIQKEVALDNHLLPEEKKILNTLYRYVIKETEWVILELMTPNATSALVQYEQNITTYFAQLQDENTISVSSGFKGFINAICEALQRKPIFTTDNKNVIENIQNIKRDLIKTKNEGIKSLTDTHDEQFTPIIGSRR